MKTPYDKLYDALSFAMCLALAITITILGVMMWNKELVLSFVMLTLGVCLCIYIIASELKLHRIVPRKVENNEFS